jgi:uncharacterized protein
MATVADDILASYSAEITELCRRFGVRRLEVFGSATTDAFDPAHSDFDFLYEFDDTTGLDAFHRYFGLIDELQRLFGRKVDLVSSKNVENPYFLRKINRQRRVVYEA